jgi:DNA-binding NarL/FixJ family response regulator
MRLDSKTWPHMAVGSSNGTGAITQQGDKITVVVAHADAIVNAGLAALLGASADITVRMAAGDAATDPAAHANTGAAASVVIVDHKAGLEYMRRLACTRPLPSSHPVQHAQDDQHTKVLIVTQLDREWEVRTAMMAGVHGYLLQNSAPDQLVAAVRSLGRGMRYLSADLSRCVADSFTRIGLTSRETDVLQLLAQGQCNKSIARELGIGVGTVKTHVKGLFDKLGATARTHAVVLATRRGLVGDSVHSQH